MSTFLYMQEYIILKQLYVKLDPISIFFTIQVSTTFCLGGFYLIILVSFSVCQKKVGL